jgi:hypothetical protein
VKSKISKLKHVKEVKILKRYLTNNREGFFFPYMWVGEKGMVIFLTNGKDNKKNVMNNLKT